MMAVVPSILVVDYCDFRIQHAGWIDMSIITNGTVHGICAPVSWVDALLSNGDDVVAKMARNALLVDALKHVPSALDLIPSDLSSNPPLSWSEQFAAEEARARWREVTAPTIGHRPTVTLFDSFGNERVITQPLDEHERWRVPKTWDEFLAKSVDAKAAGGITALVRALDKFVTDAAREFKVHDKAVKKAIADRKGVPKPETEEQKRGREAAKEKAACKRRREQQARAKIAGRIDKFSTVREQVFADRTYMPFEEAFRNAKGQGVALRSELGIRSLQLYNARLPKGTWFGRDKREIYDGSCLQRVFLLDEPYLVICWWKVRGQLVVDLDRKWDTLAALRSDIVRLIGIRLMPALIVERRDAQGRIDGAHLIWVLPPGSEVGIGGKSRTAPIRTFNMVQDALVAALMPIGADPGHENMAKTKNPLSPKFNVACTENFPTLADFVAVLPTVSVTRTEMKRRYRVMREAAGEVISPSAFEWNTVRNIVRRLIGTALHERDQVFMSSLRQESSTVYGNWLREKLIPEVSATLGIPPNRELPASLSSILRKQVEWRCAHRPSPNTRIYTGANRGRDRALYTTYGYHRLGLTGAETFEERMGQGIARQRLAGEITRANQREACIQTMIDQARLFARTGGNVDDTSALIRFVLMSGKLGRSTVYKRIGDSMDRVRDACRYIAREKRAKKLAVPPCQHEPAVVVPVVATPRSRSGSSSRCPASPANIQILPYRPSRSAVDCGAAAVVWRSVSGRNLERGHSCGLEIGIAWTEAVANVAVIGSQEHIGKPLSKAPRKLAVKVVDNRQGLQSSGTDCAS
jgi:hypothetical protein